MLLTQPQSPPALPICLPFFAFWPSQATPGLPPTPFQALPIWNPVEKQTYFSPSQLGLLAPTPAAGSSSCCLSNHFSQVTLLHAGTGLPCVLPKSPGFPFLRKTSGRFVLRLDKIQQEWAIQGQIRDTRLRGTGRGNMGQSWVIWAIWSPHSSSIMVI